MNIINKIKNLFVKSINGYKRGDKLIYNLSNYYVSEVTEDYIELLPDGFVGTGYHIPWDCPDGKNLIRQNNL